MTPVDVPETSGADAAPETVPIETAGPAVVSIADLEASQPTTGDKLGGIVASVGAFLQGRRWILGAAAGLVVIVILAVLLSSVSRRRWWLHHVGCRQSLNGTSRRTDGDG